MDLSFCEGGDAPVIFTLKYANSMRLTFQPRALHVPVERALESFNLIEIFLEQILV
jgi:hypothetical protein